tara:strand:+ start:110 stop:298 length:189 start_codon:yes stop_codon:yes gene_type:complete
MILEGERPDPGDMLKEVVDPEIKRFETYFTERAGGGPLASFEKELLRAYLWFLLMEETNEGG